METTQTLNSNTMREALNRLWKSQSDVGKRACLFNLIIYTQDPRRTHYFKDVAALVMEQLSCRIIFIQEDPNAQESYLRLQTSTEENQKSSQLLGEQIFIEAGGQDLNRIPFLVLPLFIPDVPIYLLWGQNPTKKNALLPCLQNFASRLIFDSETMENLQDFSCTLLKQLSSSPIPIVDMNWARIGGWRDVLAQTFDSPERLEQLATAHTIKIMYNTQPQDSFIHSETQALYLQAWLASRLGWQFKQMERKNGTLILNYQQASSPSSIHLIPSTRTDFTSGELLEFEASGSKDYVCHLKRKDHNQVEVHASNQFQCELPFTLIMPTLRLGKTFMQEIFYQKMSDQYVPMLELIHLSGAKDGHI